MAGVPPALGGNVIKRAATGAVIGGGAAYGGNLAQNAVLGDKYKELQTEPSRGVGAASVLRSVRGLTHVNLRSPRFRGCGRCWDGPATPAPGLPVESEPCVRDRGGTLRAGL